MTRSNPACSDVGLDVRVERERLHPRQRGDLLDPLARVGGQVDHQSVRAGKLPAQPVLV